MGTTVETKKRNRLDMLAAVENIVDLAKDSQLSEEFFNKAGRYIKYLGKRLNLTKEQTVLMALFIDHSNNRNIMANDLARETGCRTTRMIRYMNDIDELIRRGYIAKRKDSDRVSYRVPLEVIDAFKCNKTFVEKKISGLSCQDLFDEFDTIVDLVDNEGLDYSLAQQRICQLLESNTQLHFVESVSCYFEINTPTNELMLLIMFCHLFVNNNDDEVGCHDLSCMFSNCSMRIIRRNLEHGNTYLQDNGLVEFCNTDGMGDRGSYRLTMKAKREFLEELQLPMLDGNLASRNIIHSSDIKPRTMFYSYSVTSSIDDLGCLLDEKNYRDIQQRLHEQGFRSGFTCLFYGDPGTGKTETALQLARRTGRDIMQVNIAELKNCWVGESEKNIKALFDAYRLLVKDSSIVPVPILLFNEADAIIGKRKEGADRAVEKMENSLQNIILQEMETLDGILIATTNLVQNMDRAFERRFLYKIRFDRPNLEVRCSIWREMLPALSEVDAKKLADRYDFSGGEIENIARHYAIDAILHGSTAPSADNLKGHCDAERICRRKEKKIGFIQ